MNIKLNRRELLTALSSLGVLGTLPAAASAGDELPQRAIPGSGETLPIIGLGSTKPVRYIREAGTGPIESVIRKLVSYGGRVVDTSPRPAELDARFGQVLQQAEFRDALFVAKSSDRHEPTRSIAPALAGNGHTAGARASRWLSNRA